MKHFLVCLLFIGAVSQAIPAIAGPITPQQKKAIQQARARQRADGNTHKTTTGRPLLPPRSERIQ